MTAVQRQSTRSEHEASTLRLRSERAVRDLHLVEQIKRNWRDGHAVDALEALRANPELGERKSLVVDLAYEEFCLRTEAGEALDTERFAERFARYQASVRRRLEIHELLGSLNLSSNLEATTCWPVPGDEFVGYTLVEQLGQGAFARVFLATDPALGGREVVLKITAIAEREARLLGQLKHANIVTVHNVEYDAESGLSAIVMAYHGRATLCDLLDRALSENADAASSGLIEEVARCGEAVEQPTAKRRWFRSSFDEQIVEIMAQVADALSYAHGRGIQHRDLKPSNVLLDWSSRPMLLDFNLSVDPAEAHRNLGGTLPYMAPELVKGLARESVEALPQHGDRADIFALGVVLCELLTGHVPFPPVELSSNRMLEAVAEQHLANQREGPKLPASRLLQTDRRLWSIVERCVAFDPEKRPTSAAQVARELREYLSWRGRLRRRAVRQRKALAAVALVMVCLACLLGAWWWNRAPYSTRAFETGIAAYRAGDYQRAADFLTAAADAGHNKFDALVARGRSLQALGKFSLASEDYLGALQLSQNAEVHASLAFCQVNQANHDAAVYHGLQAISLGYENGAVWQIVGYSAWRSAQRDRALEYLNRAIELDPTLQQAWLSRAFIHYSIARKTKSLPRDAMADIERALEIGPETGHVHFLAALIYAAAAEEDDDYAQGAIEHIDAALRLGLDPSIVAKSPSFQVLRSHPRFATLLGRTQTSPEKYLSVMFKDPLEGKVATRSLANVGG